MARQQSYSIREDGSQLSTVNQTDSDNHIYNYRSNVSHRDMYPGHTLGTTVDVASSNVPLNDTGDDLRLRADNHTGRRMLTHFIDEPGSKHSVNTHPMIGTTSEHINYACNVHRSSNTQPVLHSSGITYTVCKLNAQGGKCLFDRGANGVVCGKDVRTISLSEKPST